MDTGSSCGEVIGQSKTVNAVAIRPARPLRAVTASDDFSLAFHTGTPYRFQRSIKDHGRFVQSVRYAPDGSRFASCGADGKIFCYDGESGERLLELKDPNFSSGAAHSSGVLALAWSPDSKRIVSVSMNGQAKAWDLNGAEGHVAWTTSVDFGRPEAKQLVGCLWSGAEILVVGLSGAYAMLNAADGTVTSIIEGHQKGFSALAIDSEQRLVSASYDGTICRWEDSKATCLTKGAGVRPGNQIEDLLASDSQLLALTLLDARGYALKGDGSIEAAAWLEGRRIAKAGQHLAILKADSVGLYEGSKCLHEVKLTASTPQSLAASSGVVAVGLENKEILLFDIQDAKLVPRATPLTANFGAISALAFSEDGSKLAAGDDQRRLKIYDLASMEPQKSNWCFHNAKISCATWLKGDFAELVITGSLDNGLMVWSLKSPIKPVVTISNAHAGPVVGVAAFADGRFASAGQDGSLKTWSLSAKS